MAVEDAQKRIKALRKKIGQIAKLKEKSELSPEEAQKVASEPTLLAEIGALERGEEFTPEEAPATPEAAPAVQEEPPEAAQQEVSVGDGQGGDEPIGEEQPEDDGPRAPSIPPAEAEKRVKALKKKLGQIQKLKDRGTEFTPEEAEKVNGEAAFAAEALELEIGLLEPEPQKAARVLQKKLDQVSKLRTKDKAALTPPEREKVSKEKALKGELDALLANRPVYREARTDTGHSDKVKAAVPAKQADATVGQGEGNLDPSEYAMIAQALRQSEEPDPDGFVQKSSKKANKKTKSQGDE
eukprot:CAMPEP_0168382084 /NCGR_PEP_ID=MMETSP0228-20121227/13207_1 /TAXON_ID=133427 /ORGANISM="Protoceratium reticulatum, Strain CCCM 535 (=CCMP 1889)" /LENGTH=296 /DNA_ID=CAMNT_0008395197 /DNA_START=76 /DNA_END=966 /DNA_ORIENTATION=-